jgi:secreted trypsin-like serine protease
MRLRTIAVLACAVCASGAGAAQAARTPRIVGGTATSIEQYPWQAALAFNDAKFTGNGFQRQFCGGTLVAPTIVITAAHCVFNVPPLVAGGVLGFNPAVNFEVFTGRTNLSSSQGQVSDVAEVYYFQGTPQAPVLQAQSTDPSKATGQLYNPSTSDWDAVFLKLAQPSTVGTPIEIAGPGESKTWAAGMPALISGWGDLADGAGNYPDQLHAAEVKIVDDATCAAAYQSLVPAQQITNTMVCAGIHPQGGVDTCQGDSGGPLVVPVFQRNRAGHANAVRLVGDTSFGEGCAQPGYPGVYGRLADDPMRSALRAGIQTVAGVDVVGSGAVPVDTDPPQTEITSHPHKRLETAKRRVRARFAFRADEPSSFECRLDGAAFASCSSPFSDRVSRGRHRFEVRATDEQGNVDSSQARFRWRVRAR